jgi:OOP family OmpA-OmpF porin
MRKLALIAVLASTAMASPALARDKAWYIGADFGPMLVENMSFNIAGRQDQATVRYRAGFDGDVNIGYDFGAFRMEAEVGYREARLRQYSALGTTPNGTAAAYGAGNRQGFGRTNALSFMVNGLLDFGPDDGVQGFVGGGVGVARVKFRNLNFFSNFPFLSDSDTNFAYQGLAGVRAPLTDNVDVSLKYRFFNSAHIDVVNIGNQSIRTRFRSHSILGGLTMNFGEPAAPPPPPVVDVPPPPPVVEAPPPPPARVCTPGPYVVFFEWNKSDITSDASSVLDNAVTAYGDCGQAQVMLAGYTDTSGTPKYNLGLSQRRADAVAGYLTSKGIPAGVISTKAFGESNLRVQTADGVRELQNRRVEITYGPGSGM